MGCSKRYPPCGETNGTLIWIWKGFKGIHKTGGRAAKNLHRTARWWCDFWGPHDSWHDSRGNKKQTQRKGNHNSSKISEKITRTFIKYSEGGAKYQLASAYSKCMTGQTHRSHSTGHCATDKKRSQKVPPSPNHYPKFSFRLRRNFDLYLWPVESGQYFSPSGTWKYITLSNLYTVITNYWHCMAFLQWSHKVSPVETVESCKLYH